MIKCPECGGPLAPAIPHGEFECVIFLKSIQTELYVALEKAGAVLRTVVERALSRDLYDTPEEWQAAIDNNILLTEIRAALEKANPPKGRNAA